MKKLLLGWGLALLCFSGMAQKPYLAKTFRGGQYQGLSITSSGGKITVTGTPSSEVQVDVYITGSNTKTPLSIDEINRRLDNYTLEVRQQGNQIVCSAKRNASADMNWKEQLIFAFDVRTPFQINTQLKTSGGAIQLKDTEGNAEIQSSGGSLTVQNVKGQIKGNTSGGAIYAEGLRESIDLSTSGGSIQAKNMAGMVKLRTSGGSISIEDVKGDIQGITSGGSIRVQQAKGKLNVQTSGGAIALDEIRGQVSAQTSGGGVTANLREISGPVTLHTSAGQVTATLPKQTGLDLEARGMRVQASFDGTFKGKQDTKSLSGQVNGGGFPVKITTSAGNVKIMMN